MFLSLSPAPEAAAPGPSDQGLLIDVFGGPPPSTSPVSSSWSDHTPNSSGTFPWGRGRIYEISFEE